MQTNVYSVFDNKAAVYGTPFFMPNDAMAVRAFEGAVNKPGSLVFDHPEDFSLFRIGNFDDGLGVLKAENVVPLVNAASLKKSPLDKAISMINRGDGILEKSVS